MISSMSSRVSQFKMLWQINDTEATSKKGFNHLESALWRSTFSHSISPRDVTTRTNVLRMFLEYQLEHPSKSSHFISSGCYIILFPHNWRCLEPWVQWLMNLWVAWHSYCVTWLQFGILSALAPSIMAAPLLSPWTPSFVCLWLKGTWLGASHFTPHNFPLWDLVDLWLATNCDWFDCQKLHQVVHKMNDQTKIQVNDCPASTQWILWTMTNHYKIWEGAWWCIRN